MKQKEDVEYLHIKRNLYWYDRRVSKWVKYTDEEVEELNKGSVIKT